MSSIGTELSWRPLASSSRRVGSPASWNYRNLDDLLQRKIEEVIHRFVASYDYGVRREDQTEVIQASGLFDRIVRIDRGFKHRTKVSDCMDAWRSHATLSRQAGPKTLGRIFENIECLLTEQGGRDVEVPYTTSPLDGPKDRCVELNP